MKNILLRVIGFFWVVWDCLCYIIIHPIEFWETFFRKEKYENKKD